MSNNIIEFKLHAPRLKMIDERLVFEFMDNLIFNTQEFTFDPTDPDSAHGTAEFWQKPRAEIIEHLTSQYEAVKSHFTGNDSFWFGDSAKFESNDIYPERLKNLPNPVFNAVAEKQHIDDIKTQTAIEAMTAQPHIFELVCRTLQSLETKENSEVIGFIGDALQSIKVADNHGHYDLTNDDFIRFAATLACEASCIYPRDDWFEALNDATKNAKLLEFEKKHWEWNEKINDVVMDLANKLAAEVQSSAFNTQQHDKLFSRLKMHSMARI
jgi:hypothetical protein